jgi:hypothetical protein
LDPKRKQALLIAGGAGLAAFAGITYFFWDQISPLLPTAVTDLVSDVEQNAFTAALLAGTPNGRAAAYADEMWQVGLEEPTVSPFMLAAIMERESGSGVYLSPTGPTGTGDGGHGRGLMQLDDRSLGGTYQGAVIGDGRWQDPYWSFKTAAVDHIEPDTAYFQGQGLSGTDLIKAVLASYNAGTGAVMKAINAGKDPDSVTTGANYGGAVLATLTKLISLAPTDSSS